jgi:hypothetical protein
VSLPAADELFRTTGGAGVQPSTPQENHAGDGDTAGPRVPAPAPAGESRPEPGGDGGGAGDRDTPAAGRAPVPAQAQRGGRTGPGRAAAGATATAGSNGQAAGAPQRRGRAPRRPSGRERHDEKITVYVSAEELMDLESARLVLRGEHGLAVDRGRIVREAVAVVLADLESRGEASILVRRLRGR